MERLKARLLEHLDQIAFFLELQGENVFKIRAFRNASESLIPLSDVELTDRIKSGSLMELKGVGKGLLLTAQNFLKSGSSDEWMNAQGKLPASLYELREISGLGPKKIKQLYEELGISKLGELEYACNENRLIGLSGFGEKSQEKILHEIQRINKTRGKFLISEALRIAEDIEAKIPRNVQYERVGDLGAKRPIVESFRYLVLYHSEKPSLKLVGQKSEESRAEKAIKDKEIQFKTKEGHAFTFVFRKPHERVVRSIFETSSEAHWQSLLKRASEKKLKLSPDALVSPHSELDLDSDTAFYAALDLPLHLPEQRELAARPSLSPPVHVDDLQGVFHAHTEDSDGSATVEQMAHAAQKRGWHYLGLSEHSQTASYAHGLDEARLQKQWQKIDELNQKFKDFQILKGIESDILKEGQLDYSDRILKQMDFVIASIHQRFGLKDMTKRLLTAIENPYTTMIGHISGRLLLSREAYDFDRHAVVNAAIKNRVVIELNCNPHRLDMDWQDLVWACEAGLLISLNPDAHSVEGLDDVEYGIWLARKAFIPKSQIINTWPVDKLKEFLKQRRP
jgi:DNA polymerase (family 10)